MEPRRGWTAQDVERRLAGLGGSPDPSGLPDWPLRAAAAVMHRFSPGTLQPFGTLPVDREAALRTLLADCEPATDATDAFVMRPDTRRRALAALGTRERMQMALSTNLQSEDDPVQRLFADWIMRGVTPLDRLSLAELEIAYRVSQWLEELLDDVPSAGRIRQALEFRRVREWFVSLAGPGFVGRAAEIRRIREFIGTFSQASRYGALSRAMRAVLPMSTVHARRPLCVYGPGGMGKTTMVARAIADHLHEPYEDRIVFAYVNLERPRFRAAESETLLNEVLEQIGAQVHEPTGLPVVVVVDSIEEMFMSGSDAGERLRSFVVALQQKIDAARIILIGRLAVDAMETERLELSTLDQEAADAFLQARGIDKSEIRQRIVGQLGGSPLTLALAAEVVGRGGEVGSVEGTGLLGASNDQLIQARLVDRLVGHIEDPDVRHLMSVAPAVRHITPEVITHVLAPALSLPVANTVEVFELLARNVAVLSRREGGSIAMRADVRAVLLPLLRQREPARLNVLHQLAVDYYAQQSGTSARAEEIYHRLALGDEDSNIDVRWEAGVEPYLLPSLDELPEASRAYLAARLGLELRQREGA